MGKRKRSKTKIPAPVILFFGVFLLLATTARATPVGRHIEGRIENKAVHAITSVFSSGPVNERLADTMAAQSYGWTGSETSCLNSLWDRETGGTWDSLITDPIAVSGNRAFGIAQALGHGLSSTAVVVPVIHFLDGHTETNVTINDYPDRSANAGSARAQIKWGLSYISGKYGTPCGAWNGTNHDASGY